MSARPSKQQAAGQSSCRKGEALARSRSGQGKACQIGGKGVRRRLPRALMRGIARRPAPRGVSPAPMGDSLTVEQRTLTPLVLVRIQVPQPDFSQVLDLYKLCLRWQGVGNRIVIQACHTTVIHHDRHTPRDPTRRHLLLAPTPPAFGPLQATVDHP